MVEDRRLKVRPPEEGDFSAPGGRQSGRVTVVDQAHYQYPDGEVCTVEARWSRPVQSDEQVYQRILKLPEGEWLAVETGWLAEGQVGVLVIQSAPDSAAPATVACGGLSACQPFAVLPPGDCLRLSPPAGARYSLLAGGPGVRCTVTAIPR